jgi:hypothetical protein
MKSRLWAFVATLLVLFIGFLNVMMGRRIRELERAISWYVRQVDRMNVDLLPIKKLINVLEEPYKSLGKTREQYPSWMKEDL